MLLRLLVTTTTDEPPVGLVAVYGEVNSETAALMDAQLDGRLQHSGRVVLDLSHANYVSSAGWRSLADRCTRNRPAGVAVAGMQVGVRDAYDLLGMSYVVRAYETPYDAVEALRKAPATAEAASPPVHSGMRGPV